MFTVQILPEGRVLSARQGENLLALLRRCGCAPDAPCGGNGTCGKCRVLLDGLWISACKTAVDRNMTVVLPRVKETVLCGVDRLQPVWAQPGEGFALAFDIGTTTLAAALLEAKTGTVLAQAGAANPQSAYGADVISRIRHALAGEAAAMTRAVRQALMALAQRLCADAGIAPEQVMTVCAVGIL